LILLHKKERHNFKKSERKTTMTNQEYGYLLREINKEILQRKKSCFKMMDSVVFVNELFLLDYKFE
jgi:hypothetical protein